MVYGLDSDPVYPNLYVVIFAGSGVGKDRTVSQVSTCYEIVEGYHNSFYNDLKEGVTIDLYARADKLSQEAVDKGRKAWSKAEKKVYVERYIPHEVKEKFGSGTPEGLIAHRQAFASLRKDKTGIGSIHFENSEILDWIRTSSSSAQTDIKELLKTVAEEGHNETKLIKGEKEIKPVRNVPQTLLAFSSVAKLLDNGKANAQLEEFLERGLGRRSMICYPEEYKYTKEDYKNQKGKKKEAMLYRAKLTELFEKLHTYTLRNLKADENEHFHKKVIADNDELDEHIYNYQEECFERTDRMSPIDRKVFEGVIGGHPRKALRLAGIITVVKAVLAKKKEFIMTIEDYDEAVYQIEYYFDQYYKFYNRSGAADVEYLYNYIINNQGKDRIYRGDIRKQKFARSKGNYLSQWIKDMLGQEGDGEGGELEEYCIKQKKILIALQEGKAKFPHYKIENTVEVDQKTQSREIPKAKLSITSSTEHEHPIHGFTKQEIDFTKVPEMVKKYKYTTHTFTNDHRKKENTEYYGNLLIIDIDNDCGAKDQLYIEQAVEIVKDYHSIVVPSQNHQRVKENNEELGAVDRYRIILLCDSVIAPENDYKSVMTKCVDSLGLLPYYDTSVTSDKARYLKESPKGCEHFIHAGKYLFNWKVFDKPENVPKKYVPSKRYGEAHDYREVPLAELVELAGGKFKKKIGDNLYYYCPFHSSTTGTSFWITENINIFYCCKCDPLSGQAGQTLGGPPVNFIRRWKGVNGHEAYKMLKEYLLTGKI